MAEYKVIVPINLEVYLQKYVDGRNRTDPVLGTPTQITKDEAVTERVISWLSIMEKDASREEAQSVAVDYDKLSELDQAEVRALIDSKKV